MNNIMIPEELQGLNGKELVQAMLDLENSVTYTTKASFISALILIEEYTEAKLMYNRSDTELNDSVISMTLAQNGLDKIVHFVCHFMSDGDFITKEWLDIITAFAFTSGKTNEMINLLNIYRIKGYICDRDIVEGCIEISDDSNELRILLSVTDDIYTLEKIVDKTISSGDLKTIVSVYKKVPTELECKFDSMSISLAGKENIRYKNMSH